MAIKPAIESVSNGTSLRGRTQTSAHVIDLAEASHRPEFHSLLGSTDGVTHLEVAVAVGPFGPEVLVLPRAGDRLLPGELYAQLPGAFGAPAAFDRSGGNGLAWASPSAELQAYLQTHQFGAPALPGGLRHGETHIDLEWTIQLIALGVGHSMVACQLSNADPVTVEHALVAIDRLSSVTSQSKAAGPQGGLHPFRFGFVVELALTDQLEVPPPPPPAVPAPVAVDAPPPPAPVTAETFETFETFETDSFAPDSFDAQSFDRESFSSGSFDSGSFDAASLPLDSFENITDDREVVRFDTFAIEDAELDAAALYDMSATSWEASADSGETIDASARVAEALARYEGKRVTVGAITDQKKLANVLRSIAPEIEAEEMCGFVDTGARSNGKSGAVFTATAVHFTGLSGRQSYEYAAIESFKLEASAVILNGTDGTRAKISTSGQLLPVAEAIAAATGLSV